MHKQQLQGTPSSSSDCAALAAAPKTRMAGAPVAYCCSSPLARTWRLGLCSNAASLACGQLSGGLLAESGVAAACQELCLLTNAATCADLISADAELCAA